MISSIHNGLVCVLLPFLFLSYPGPDADASHSYPFAFAVNKLDNGPLLWTTCVESALHKRRLREDG
jgi:hypothetical protein